MPQLLEYVPQTQRTPPADLVRMFVRDLANALAVVAILGAGIAGAIVLLYFGVVQ